MRKILLLVLLFFVPLLQSNGEDMISLSIDLKSGSVFAILRNNSNKAVEYYPGNKTIQGVYEGIRMYVMKPGSDKEEGPFTPIALSSDFYHIKKSSDGKIEEPKRENLNKNQTVTYFVKVKDYIDFMEATKWNLYEIKLVRFEIEIDIGNPPTKTIRQTTKWYPLNEAAGTYIFKGP